MSSTFEIKSTNDDGILKFTGEIPRGLTGYDGTSFQASLTTGNLSAATTVYDIQPHRWSDFFAQLAADWRGWTGTRGRESLEKQIRIEATADSLGHIQLGVFLREDSVCGWRAQGTINVEAGQLEQLARRAKAFFG